MAQSKDVTGCPVDWSTACGWWAGAHGLRKAKGPPTVAVTVAGPTVLVTPAQPHTSILAVHAPVTTTTTTTHRRS